MSLPAVSRRGTVIALIASLVFVGVTPIAAQAATTGAVSGVVTGQTAQGSPDVAVEFASVELYPVAGGPAVSIGYTDDAGRYLIDGIAAGTYAVRISPPDGRYLSQWFSGASTAATATPVTVNSGATTSAIDVVLASSVGGISGTVLGITASGARAPVQGARVELYSSDGSTPVGFVETDSTGYFRFFEITVRSYKLHVASIGAYLGEWWNDKPDLTYSADVVVRSGAVTSGIGVVLSTQPNDHALTPTPTPLITGTPRFGSTLTVVRGTWGPGSVTLAVQWLRSGAPISGATGTTYTLTAADVGASISVRVTGSKAGYRTTSRTSMAVVGIAATLTSTAPTISGTARVGVRLTATPGAWGPAPVTLAYQWKANGVAIAGATGSSYVVGSGALGKKLAVKVTGTKPGYTTVVRQSVATAAVVG